MPSARPRVGISACLLGERVRYDGGGKRAPELIRRLGPHLTWVALCPEVELGLGVPREPIRLEREAGGVRLRGVESGADRTEAMEAWARARLAALEGLGVSGWVLKARSPSCGPRGVPLHDGQGREVGADAGRFAAAVRARWPDVPMRQESELADEPACRTFLDAVRAWAAARGEA